MLALGLAAIWGCRTPFGPPAVPVANLYPTLCSSTVLGEARPVALTETDLSALLAHLGALGPLRSHGMAAGELPLARRGLARHGYAELDARRTACPVRWVILRGLAEANRPCLVVEVGYSSAPAVATQYAIDLAQPAAETGTRTDAYGRVSRIETWRGIADSIRVEVRRVFPPGLAEFWEVEYRAPVRQPTDAGS
jgi:hypothetical protein